METPEQILIKMTDSAIKNHFGAEIWQQILWVYKAAELWGSVCAVRQWIHSVLMASSLNNLSACLLHLLTFCFWLSTAGFSIFLSTFPQGPSLRPLHFH